MWRINAHDHQREPHGDWTTWLIIGGRGAGKTRAGAEWVRAAVAGGSNDNTASRSRRSIALVAETYADAREVMIEGPSGIRAVATDADRPAYEASRRRLVWPSGAVAYAFSAEDPDGIRGYQFDAAWSDELCKWRYPEKTWSNLQLALRLGDKPRQIATTTPRPMALLKRLIAAKTSAVTRASTYENRAHLSDAFFTEIAALYEGTALGRQELLGEMIDDIAGALWTWNLIEAARIGAAPPLSRVVVAVDPPATSGPDADECGIVIAGVALSGEIKTAFVLADWSAAGLSPRQWAEKTVAAYHEFEADRIVVEVNQGGDMAKAGGDIALSWTRRTRAGGDSWEGDVPLSEASERYRLRIFDGANELRSVEMTTPDYLYAAADILADFGAPGPGAAITFSVAQISDAVGEGVIRQENVKVT